MRHRDLGTLAFRAEFSDVFNFVKLRLAVKCRAQQRIRLHKHGRVGLCRQTQFSLKVGFMNSLREV
jgi:hypothetical protein